MVERVRSGQTVDRVEWWGSFDGSKGLQDYHCGAGAWRNKMMLHKRPRFLIIFALFSLFSFTLYNTVKFIWNLPRQENLFLIELLTIQTSNPWLDVATYMQKNGFLDLGHFCLVLGADHLNPNKRGPGMQTQPGISIFTHHWFIHSEPTVGVFSVFNIYDRNFNLFELCGPFLHMQNERLN